MDDGDRETLGADQAPLAIASSTEPPAESMKMGRRRPASAPTTRSSASADPLTILPSADIHSGQFGSHAGPPLITRTKRIGARDDGVACGVGRRRMEVDGVACEGRRPELASIANEKHAAANRRNV